MWSQDKYQKAIKFAAKAHQWQKVPGTKISYIVHISNVCMEIFAAFCASPEEFDYDLAVQCALLHDTIEDTMVKFKKLDKKFGNRVAEGVMALSKNPKLHKDKRLADSLTRLSTQPKEVKIVKLADRITNLQKPPIKWSNQKRKYYLESSLLILEELEGTNQFLEKRLEKKIEEYKQYIYQ